MAIFNCNQADLANDAKDYRVGVISPHERKALTVYAKVRFLASVSGIGTDYTSNYPQLFLDAANATLGIDPDAIEAAKLNMWFTKCENEQQTINTPIVLPVTLSARTLAAKTLAAQPDTILDRIDLFLDCKINAALFNT